MGNDTSRRAIFSGATAIIAAAAAFPAAAKPQLPPLTRELAERYLAWLEIEKLSMHHWLGTFSPDYDWTPMDRMVGCAEPEKAAARAVPILAAVGVSVEPDPDAALRRYGSVEAIAEYERPL